MPQNNYKFTYDEYGNTRGIEVFSRGADVHGNNYTNKGTAFTNKERRLLGLSGLLPPTVRPLRDQVKNSLHIADNTQGDIEKYIYIRSLFARNVTLAHALIASHIERFMKIIYTPTVGLACQQFSSMFRKANGLHFFPGNINRAKDILTCFKHRNIRVAVVTDNQGILGIGDQGAGGIAICLGKLMLYTQGTGIAPWHCLPISLDVGTDNEELLNDPNYLGWRHERLRGQEYVKFIQQFAGAFKKTFPHAICQWEDFSKQNAFAIRDAYLNDIISFNDDIQGTGAVAHAAILTAMKIKKEKMGDQIYLIHGAGAGGVGIAEQIEAALLGNGHTEAEAQNRIYTLDSKGLVTSNRDLEPYKMKFAKNPAELSWYNDEKDGTLENVVKKAGITVLIGTSGQAGSFTKKVVKAMSANTDRPVILPLSNPTAKAEATPEDIYRWTSGKALIAAGSPFGPANHQGKTIRIGQCNNVFVFPGVGLGVLASGAKEVLPSFFTAAAHAVSDLVPLADRKQGILMPEIKSLRKASLKVALAVGAAAIREGVSAPCAFSTFQHRKRTDRLKTLIEKMRWTPKYLPLIPK